MARRWTREEEGEKRQELIRLYVEDNKTIGEIGQLLYLSESTIYDRLIRLGIPPIRSQKRNYNNIRHDIVIPREHSPDLAEFFGVLLGDGHLTPTQVTVTLGKKDEYISYTVALMSKLFGAKPKVTTSGRGDRTVYIGSTKIVRWLMLMGLVFNKVKAQVDVPSWIFSRNDFMRATIRGLFDTDGSVYKLRFGLQLSFSNRSLPLLSSFRLMLSKLGYHPSKVTVHSVYLTRKEELYKYFYEIGFGNEKHTKRFLRFLKV